MKTKKSTISISPKKTRFFGGFLAIAISLVAVISASFVLAQTLGNSVNSGLNYTTNSTNSTIIGKYPPSVTLSADSISLTAGQSTTIRWSSSGATSCTASGAWTGSRALSGSQVFSSNTQGSFTLYLSCSNAYGATTRSVTINVASAQVSFIRGDVAAPYGLPLDMADMIAIFDSLQQQRPTLSAPKDSSKVAKCRAAADVDVDGDVDTDDGLYLLSFLYGGGPAPRANYPLKGVDPTPTAYQLGCTQYP